MASPTYSVQRGERIIGISLIVFGAVGLIVGFASGHAFIAAVCGALAGISLSVLAFRILLRSG
jgi:hypothetical protein